MFEIAQDAAWTPWGLATAGGLGLLIGIERERRKGEGPQRAAAGIRTFTLLGLTGAIAQVIGPLGVAVSGLCVTLLALASYRRTAAHDPGLTTELAMLVTWLLGLLAMGSPALAAGIGVVVAGLLAAKLPMHHFVRDHLTERELHDGLVLVAAAFVVLPMLPDRTIDPWDALNPHRLWVLVVAVLAVSAAGYLALRLLGPRLGLALAGLAGGFVSSTATIASMADKARETPALTPAYAAAGLISNVATIVQMAVVIGAVCPPLLRCAAVPLAAAGATAVLAAIGFGWRALASVPGDLDLGGKRPFQLRQVLGFVALLASVMLVSALMRAWLGDGSLPWVLAASGLADVHAATASGAQLVATGQVPPGLAMTAITAALASNSLTKCVRLTQGRPRLRDAAGAGRGADRGGIPGDGQPAATRLLAIGDRKPNWRPGS